MADPALAKAKVVLGAIGDDIHVVGIRLLAHALMEAGAEVIQLGVQTPPEEFVSVAVEEDASAVFVSSSNGHASWWCTELRDSLDAAGADDVLLYIGGNLAIGGSGEWSEIEAQFLGMGFDRVYRPRTRPEQAVNDLARDLDREL